MDHVHEMKRSTTTTTTTRKKRDAREEVHSLIGRAEAVREKAGKYIFSPGNPAIYIPLFPLYVTGTRHTTLNSTLVRVVLFVIQSRRGVAYCAHDHHINSSISCYALYFFLLLIFRCCCCCSFDLVVIVVVACFLYLHHSQNAT